MMPDVRQSRTGTTGWPEPLRKAGGLLRNRPFAGVAVALVLALVLFPSALSFKVLALEKPDREKKKQQIEKIESYLSREMRQLTEFGKKEKRLVEQLSRLEKGIEEKKGLIREIQWRTRQGESQLEELEKQLSQLELDLKSIEQRFRKRLVAFYKYARRGYIYLLATSSGLNELRKRVKYLQVLSERDRALFRKVMSAHMDRERTIREIQKGVSTLKELEREERESMASLKKDHEKKIILLMKIHKEREFYETAVRELQLGARDLRNTLINLERKPGISSQLPSGFPKARGKLPLPLDGKILRDAGVLGANLYGSRKGVYFLGKARSEVRAIFPGRVEYSGWLKGYGQIIVINHGSRYFSVYAYLSRRNKKKSDLVGGGEVIGSLGETGPIGGPMLYFEIRKGSKSLSPMKWLKVN
ncbi:MAG: peptidoglycan DD-metalloendopeptidase family protein [Deltaproteobacteria bacterium]|nr:peptidoglycan DD-metalloendopeptidase family protein [Deltaproteobacteria bacterium]